MTPFIKLAHDLGDIRSNGFNESLFITDYVPITPLIAADLSQWCLTNLPTTVLKSKDANEDEATFYLLQFDKENTDIIEGFRLKLSEIVRSVVFAAAATLKDDDCSSPETDGTFDDLDAATNMRKIIILLPNAASLRKGSKAAILIYIK